MYSKEELQAKSVVQLKDIAKELGVKVKKSDNKETIVYAILDAQAEQPAPEAAPKRKRTRIATKKEDRVYSVHGNEGENFDVQKNQVLGPNGGETAPQAMSETAPAPAVEEEIQFSPAEQSLQSAAQKQTLNQSGEDIEAQVLANFPKHRGRRSKAELEAIAEARAAAIRKHQAVKAELEAQMAKMHWRRLTSRLLLRQNSRKRQQPITSRLLLSKLPFLKRSSLPETLRALTSAVICRRCSRLR